MTARYQAIPHGPGDWRIQDSTTGVIGPPWHLNWLPAQTQADQMNVEAAGPNAHAGEIPCPRCGSADLTMPYPLAPRLWVCDSCHRMFAVPKAAAA